MSSRRPGAQRRLVARPAPRVRITVSPPVQSTRCRSATPGSGKDSASRAWVKHCTSSDRQPASCQLQ